MLGPWRRLEPRKGLILLVSPCVDAELSSATYQVKSVYPDLVRAYRDLDLALGGDPIAVLRGGIAHDGAQYYMVHYNNGDCLCGDVLADTESGWRASLQEAIEALVKRARSRVARRPVACH